MKQRALSIDALRGYAIVTMVLSATIVTSLLPGWMSHAQTPPPYHEFNPDLPGITWVDMVFPTFLFALGAALPFSIGRKFSKGASKLTLSAKALWRGIKLAYFAILIQHFYPYMLSNPQDMQSWLLAIFCFALLFPTFMRLPWKMPSLARTAIQLCAMAVGIIVMLNVNYADGQPFSLYTRQLVLNLCCSAAAIAAGLFILRDSKGKGYAALWRRLFVFGSFMLILGLAWESYEGGIKKDPVTFSYLFTTGGLSFMTLIFFSIICDYYNCRRATSFLVLSGQNPMMAYVANDLLIFPLLQICGLTSYFGIFTHSVFGAFMQGVAVTALAVAVTMLFTRLKCIWRT